MIVSRAPLKQRAVQCAFFAALAVVTVGSVVPGVPAPVDLSMIDKVLHFCGYLVLGLLGGIGWPERRSASLVMIPLFGLALEVVQIMVPGRGFDWLDAAANGLGALTGVWLAGHCLHWVARAG